MKKKKTTLSPRQLGAVEVCLAAVAVIVSFFAFVAFRGVGFKTGAVAFVLLLVLMPLLIFSMRISVHRSLFPRFSPTLILGDALGCVLALLALCLIPPCRVGLGFGAVAVLLYLVLLSLCRALFEGRETVVREFSAEELLGRDPLTVADEKTHSFYRHRCLLVTGGGGSIGGELCRQLALCHPKKIIIFDIYENCAHDLQGELKRKYGNEIEIVVEIGSVRDRARLEAVFSLYRPEVVFHAAAHKHVHFMESGAGDAVKNNILGTENCADMAEKYGSERFILISTDKAVNPTGIMGASKRMCEMIIQSRQDSSTVFSAVRFGNVLDSAGSVVPLFKRQIAEGGPVTVTDKRMKRYFMSIPEAVGLVMQAGAMARNGELFVLDMGHPVLILELAEKMIRLSGFRPYRDIDVVEIGLRPGERLYEEILFSEERVYKTENKMIFIEKDEPYTRDEIRQKLDLLRSALDSGACERERVVEAMRIAVPEYRPDSVS